MKKSLIDECRISIAGYLFYHLLPIRRDIVLKNIDRVFNDTYSAKEKKHLAKSFYSHLFSTLREFFFMSWYSEEKLNNMVEIRGVEHLVTAQNQGQGCLLLTGHLGNWELTSLVALSRLKTLIGTVHEIRKAIRVKWLERFIFKRVARSGIQRIDKQGASIKIIKALKKKEIVIFTMDQHAALKHKEGIAVDFFGYKSGTYRSLAFFANRYRAPVVPLSVYRKPNGVHVFEFHPALTWEAHPDEEQAIYNNTVRYNQTLEAFILAHPEQWWWVHRRWKLMAS